jgi:hypothetical protein
MVRKNWENLQKYQGFDKKEFVRGIQWNGTNYTAVVDFAQDAGAEIFEHGVSPDNTLWIRRRNCAIISIKYYQYLAVNKKGIITVEDILFENNGPAEKKATDPEDYA